MTVWSFFAVAPFVVWAFSVVVVWLFLLGLGGVVVVLGAVDSHALV